MVTVQARLRFHIRVAVLPVVVAGVVAIFVTVTVTGVGIAGTEILTIGVRVILGAISGIFDHLLRQRGSCETRRGNGGGAQCEFHLDLLSVLDGVTRTWDRAVGSPIS